MINTNSKVCKSCKYGKILLGFRRNEYFCDYFLMTGNRRACEVGECDKYDKRESKNAKTV